MSWFKSFVYTFGTCT
uniref:Uncharacterized protein n=1 Tax=Anguilla anguilla TaxID=7936 RepID=A0A0E9XZL2_ANGAN